jgi:hypothetical protein
MVCDTTANFQRGTAVLREGVRAPKSSVDGCMEVGASPARATLAGPDRWMTQRNAEFEALPRLVH